MSDEKLYMIHDDTGNIPESEWAEEVKEYNEKMIKEVEEKYSNK